MIPYLKRFYLIPWTIWCLIVFSIINIFGVFFLFIFLSIPSYKSYRLAHHIPTIVGRLSCLAFGVWVRIEGNENFDSTRQYVFVGNHRSMLDALISSGYIPNLKKFIGKAELLSWPFLGYIMSKLYIPVKRDNAESKKWSREQLILRMKEGFSMVLFPEGMTNSSDQNLLSFKTGAFDTACTINCPIVPFVIDRADHLWHRRVWLIRPGIITLRFLPEILPLENTEENVNSLRDRAFQSILDNYLQMKG